MADTSPNGAQAVSRLGEELSPVESEILDEYTRLLNNLNTLSDQLNELATKPTAEMLDGLRDLERKMSLVSTLLKASVYSIVLQNEIYRGGQAAEE